MSSVTSSVACTIAFYHKLARFTTISSLRKHGVNQRGISWAEPLRWGQATASSGAALALLRYCFSTALVLLWRYFGAAMILLWRCSGAVLVLLWRCFGAVPSLF